MTLLDSVVFRGIDYFMKQEFYTLAELAQETEVPARTIRYYITRGLVPGPCKNGRDASYDGSHVERLKQIRALQQSGLTLAELGQRLGTAGAPAPLPPGGRCMLYHISSEVTMMVREEASPWKLKQIHRAMAELREILNKEGMDHE